MDTSSSREYTLVDIRKEDELLDLCGDRSLTKNNNTVDLGHSSTCTGVSRSSPSHSSAAQWCLGSSDSRERLLLEVIKSCSTQIQETTVSIPCLQITNRIIGYREGVSELPSFRSCSRELITQGFYEKFGRMPIPFWDGYFRFLLRSECPEWPRTDKVNRALGHMQLMACGCRRHVAGGESPHFLLFYVRPN